MVLDLETRSIRPDADSSKEVRYSCKDVDVGDSPNPGANVIEASNGTQDINKAESRLGIADSPVSRDLAGASVLPEEKILAVNDKGLPTHDWPL